MWQKWIFGLGFVIAFLGIAGGIEHYVLKKNDNNQVYNQIKSSNQ